VRVNFSNDMIPKFFSWNEMFINMTYESGIWHLAIVHIDFYLEVNDKFMNVYIPISPAHRRVVLNIAYEERVGLNSGGYKSIGDTESLE
jgi:hypothetical protein